MGTLPLGSRLRGNDGKRGNDDKGRGYGGWCGCDGMGRGCGGGGWGSVGMGCGYDGGGCGYVGVGYLFLTLCKAARLNANQYFFGCEKRIGFVGGWGEGGVGGEGRLSCFG